MGPEDPLSLGHTLPGIKAMPVIQRNSSGDGGQYLAVGRPGASDLTDSAVIRASLGEPQAFGQIFDRHAAVVHRYLTSRVGREAADDLLSEVFMAAFRRRLTYDPHYASAVPWLLGIAINVVRHRYRSESRRSALLRRLDQRVRDRSDAVVDDIATEVIGRTEFVEVQRAVGGMDDRYRDVLILYSAFDLSYEEVALALGIRIGTVRSRLSRGRDQLRELLLDAGQYVTDDHALSSPKPDEGQSS